MKLLRAIKIPDVDAMGQFAGCGWLYEQEEGEEASPIVGPLSFELACEIEDAVNAARRDRQRAGER